MVPFRDRVFGRLLAVHQFVYQRSGGRIGASLAGRPMLLLHTTGRRSGLERTAALAYVHDGDGWVVVASAGGSDRHPGWYHNLVSEPEVSVQISRAHHDVRAEVVDDDVEYRRLWAVVDDMNNGMYSTYQQRTERQIPLVVLRPR